MNTPTISAEEMENLMGAAFPLGFVQKAHTRVSMSDVVHEVGPLDSSHVALMEAHLESGNVLHVGLQAPGYTLKAIRHTHHRLAQFLASGMDETIAAKLCNYHPQRVSHLKLDPAFQELMAHYKGVVDDEFADFQTAAAALSIDMLGALQQMLDEAPEKFGPGHLMDAIKLLADRTGHAPVTKSIAVNVNADIGAKLTAARERIRNITPSGG